MPEPDQEFRNLISITWKSRLFKNNELTSYERDYGLIITLYLALTISASIDDLAFGVSYDIRTFRIWKERLNI